MKQHKGAKIIFVLPLFSSINIQFLIIISLQSSTQTEIFSQVNSQKYTKWMCMQMFNPQSKLKPEIFRINKIGLYLLPIQYRNNFTKDVVDLYTFFQKFCIMDSIRRAKNIKLLDSFWFGRIRIWIPHPYNSCIAVGKKSIL